MPWQDYTSARTLECDADGRLVHNIALVMAGRQNGKTGWLKARILWELYVRRSRLSVHTAQDRGLAREIFLEVVDLALSHPRLAAEIPEGGVRKANGQESLTLRTGERYMIVAPTPGAARGKSVDGLAIIDETREHRSWDLWAALSKTTQAKPNPQILLLSNAGDDFSVLLNHFQELGRRSAREPDVAPNLCFLEWSADPALPDGSPEAWAQANPGLGHMVSWEKIAQDFETDPAPLFITEVLCRRVANMQGILPDGAWESCAVPAESLAIEPGAVVYLAFDVTPSRDEAVLVMAAPVGDRIAVSVIESWQNPGGINDRDVDAAILALATEYTVGAVGYDPRFGFSIGQRLQAAGIPVAELAGVRFYAASQGLFDAVVNSRLIHAGDPYLAAQVNAAARQDVADGSWRISRKHSNVSIAGVVATAIAHQLCTEPDRLPGLH